MAPGGKRALGDDASPSTGTQSMGIPSVETLAPPIMQAPSTPASMAGPLPLLSTSQLTPSPTPPMTQALPTPASMTGTTHSIAVFQEQFIGPYHTWSDILQPIRDIWMKMASKLEAKDRLRDLLGDTQGKNKRPPWIDESYWAVMWNN
ncbi:hypothetical protein M9H77_04005 [Catharanthus roseus]|uniref:Uncharacterized protein n=1 Tax=Catharanthus roseus TaxID=4058 RepID=A0ACC0CCV3_CATRO|nr:hypothetical protein M9H77_04005 [Catharanthus roseus]